MTHSCLMSEDRQDGVAEIDAIAKEVAAALIGRLEGHCNNEVSAILFVAICAIADHFPTDAQQPFLRGIAMMLNRLAETDAAISTAKQNRVLN